MEFYVSCDFLLILFENIWSSTSIISFHYLIQAVWNHTSDLYFYHTISFAWWMTKTTSQQNVHAPDARDSRRTYYSPLAKRRTWEQEAVRDSSHIWYDSRKVPPMLRFLEALVIYSRTSSKCKSCKDATNVQVWFVNLFKSSTAVHVLFIPRCVWTRHSWYHGTSFFDACRALNSKPSKTRPIPAQAGFFGASGCVGYTRSQVIHA